MPDLAYYALHCPNNNIVFCEQDIDVFLNIKQSKHKKKVSQANCGVQLARSSALAETIWNEAV